MKKVNVGIIGFGFMGHTFVNSELKGFEEFNVVAICDIDEPKMADAPAGVTCYNNADEMIADPRVETVIIASDNKTHLEMVTKAAKAGKDILCEKPVALSMAELVSMEEVVKENGVKFTVHQQRRFDKDFRSIKEVYDAGTLGDIYTIKSSLYGFNGNMHDWHVFKSEGGGMLYDWGVHLIDQMLWMVKGKIKTVYAFMKNVINTEVDDYFKIILRFENDMIAEIELGTYYLTDKPVWFERHWFVGGNKGSAYIDGFAPTGKTVTTTKLLTNVPGAVTMTAAGPTRSFGPPAPGLIIAEEIPLKKTEHRDFMVNYLKTVTGEEEFVVKIPEVKRVLAVMEAARESSRTGRTVDFE